MRASSHVGSSQYDAVRQTAGCRYIEADAANIVVASREGVVDGHVYRINT